MSLAEMAVQDLFQPPRYREGIAAPGGSMDLDLRKLRYFVTVADRLHFSRAADELHIAQPVLSRQIRALEHDLGTPLLTRDSHGVELTDAGRQLLADAGPLLASPDAVRRRVTAAAARARRRGAPRARGGARRRGGAGGGRPLGERAPRPPGGAGGGAPPAGA